MFQHRNFIQYQALEHCFFLRINKELFELLKHSLKQFRQFDKTEEFVKTVFNLN